MDIKLILLSLLRAGSIRMNNKYQMYILIIVGFLFQVNTASAVVVGVDTGQGNCIPFGCARGSVQYQQVYDNLSFGGLLEINSISFYHNIPWGGNDTPASGIFNFSLSTTSKLVDGLSASLEDNLGPDNTLVFSGELPNIVSLGSQMDIILDTAFTYTPNIGNLLLTVESSNAVSSSFYLDVAINNSDDMSRRHSATGGDSAGLVTGFNEVSAVPVPAAVWLFASGLAGLIGVARRKA